MENLSLSQESLENALGQLSEWFPEQASKIDKYEAEIVQNILDNTRPDKNFLLGKLAVQPKSATSLPLANPSVTAAVAMVVSTKQGKDLSTFIASGIALPQIADDELFSFSGLNTPCNRAIAMALANAGFFVLGMFGIRGKANEKLATALINEIGPAINTFDKLVSAFAKADGFYEQGKVFFKLIGGIYKASGWKVLIKEWTEGASWYDWVITGAVIVAQLTAWFATDGLAFAAEVALLLGSAYYLTESIIKAVNVCSANECNPVTSVIKGANFTPKGSFAYTASDVVVTLSASCRNKAGQEVTSELNITQLPVEAQVDNIDGRLQISNTPGKQSPATFVPQGSYKNTSNNIKVTLSAKCKNIIGDIVSSVLDISSLAINIQVANIDGVLTPNR